MCAGLWLLLDDTAAMPELIDGAMASIIGASAATLLQIRLSAQLAPRLGWMRRGWRPIVRLVSDLPMLVATLVRALTGGEREPGRLRSVSFSLEPDQANRSAQIALAVVAGSVAPSTIILAVDEENQMILFHELIGSTGRESADPLELG